MVAELACDVPEKTEPAPLLLLEPMELTDPMGW